MKLHPWFAVRYLSWLVGQVVLGTALVVREAFGRRSRVEAAIVEFPLRCTTDLEVTLMASSITITPGTLVVGAAPANRRPDRGVDPPALFVHSLFDADRESVIAGLREMETRLLRMTRGRSA